MAATSLDLSQIKTDALSAASTFRTLIGLGTGDTPTFKATTLSTGTITASTPALDISQTWNNNAVAFTGLKFNATDTASSASSLLMDLQVGGVSQFNVSKVGAITIANPGRVAAQLSRSALIIGQEVGANYGHASYSSSLGFVFRANTTTGAGFAVASNSITPTSNGFMHLGWPGLAWASLRLATANTTDTAELFAEGIGVLAQRNSTNQQRFNLYGTYSDGANYRRLYLDSTTAGAFTIGVEGAGTGASGNTLELQTGGTSRLTIDASGNCGIGTTSPSQKLDVRGDLLVTTGTTTGVQLSRGIGTYAWQGPSMYLFSDPAIGLGTYGGLYWSGPNGGNADAFNFSNGLLLISNGSGGLSIATTLTNNPAPIRFFTGGYALSNERMRLNPIGNLGLGTTSPLSKLDIADTWNSNVTVTGASGTGTTATLTFSAMTTAFPVGSTIVVTSVNPSGYNGTFTVTASTTTSVSYANTTTGAYVSGGTIKQLFTALKVNVTDTSSDAGSLLMDLQVGGSSQFQFTKNRQLYINSYQSGYTGQSNYEGFLFYGGPQGGSVRHGLTARYGQASNGIALWALGTAYVGVANWGAWFNTQIGWSSGSVTSTSPDTFLVRDAANALAMQNSTAAQTFRIYKTWANNGVDYERAVLDWQTTADVLRIGTEAGGTGTVRNIALVGGNVGIGTTSPAQKLVIQDSQNGEVGFTVTNQNTSGTSGSSVFNFVSGSTITQIVATNQVYNDGGGYGSTTSSLQLINRGGPISFKAGGYQDAYERMRITTAGLIGIGTSSPAAKLDISDTTGAGSGSLYASALNIAQTWNTTGTPTAFKLNVTDTASSASSLLMDLQVGGTTQFNVSKTGNIVFGGGRDSVDFVASIRTRQSSDIAFGNGSGNFAFLASTVGFFVTNNLALGWTSGVPNTRNTFIYRDADGIIAQRNSTNAQTFRIYNTYTDATNNFERGKIGWSGNVFQIGTEKGLTSGSARALELQTDGTTRLTIEATSGVTVINKSQFGSGGNNGNYVASINGRVLLRTASGDGVNVGYIGSYAYWTGVGTSENLTYASYQPETHFFTNSQYADGEQALILKSTEVVLGKNTTCNGNLTLSTKNIVTDTTTGTKIGTATNQKLGFYNSTPVVQPAAVADATDAASVITQLNLLLARMRDLGLIAT